MVSRVRRRTDIYVEQGEKEEDPDRLFLDSLSEEGDGD